LLVGLAVYRVPVDANAILFQVGHPDPDAAWVPDRAAAKQRVLAALAQHGIEPETLNEHIEAGTVHLLPAGLVGVIGPDLAELAAEPRPAYRPPTDLPDLLAALTETTLLAPVRAGGGTGQALWVVHRWTASELSRRLAHLDGTPSGVAGATAAGGWTAAHQRAAGYWQWRVEVWPQDPDADVHDLLEARYHHLAVGDLNAADEVSGQACVALEGRGAWDHASSIAADTLQRFPDEHPRRAVWIHHLGILAQARGDFAEAERRYTQALTTFEQVGDQAGMADSDHELGRLAQARGDYAEAERRYTQALTINERIGNQAGIATTYSLLGILGTARGQITQAIPLHLTALLIRLKTAGTSGRNRRTSAPLHPHQPRRR